MLEGREKVAMIHQTLMKLLSRGLHYKTMYKVSVRERREEKGKVSVCVCTPVCMEIKNKYTGTQEYTKVI